MIVDFYNQCVDIFYEIINVGTIIWSLVTTPISDLVTQVPPGIFQDVLSWITTPFQNISILSLGLGSSLTVYFVIVILKFIKII